MRSGRGRRWRGSRTRLVSRRVEGCARRYQTGRADLSMAPPSPRHRPSLASPALPDMGAGAAAGASARAAVNRWWRGKVARGPPIHRRILTPGPAGVPARDEQTLAGVDQVRIGDRASVDVEDAPPGTLVAIVQPGNALQRVARSDHVPAGAFHRPARPPARVGPILVPVPCPRHRAVAVRPGGAPRCHPVVRRPGGPGVVRPVTVRLRAPPLILARRGRRPIRARPLGTRRLGLRCRKGTMRSGRTLGQQVHHPLEVLPGAPQPPHMHLPAGRVAVFGLPRSGRDRRGQAQQQAPKRNQGHAGCRQIAPAHRRRKGSPHHAPRILRYACRSGDVVNDVGIP